MSINGDAASHSIFYGLVVNIAICGTSLALGWGHYFDNLDFQYRALIVIPEILLFWGLYGIFKRMNVESGGGDCGFGIW